MKSLSVCVPDWDATEQWLATTKWFVEAEIYSRLNFWRVCNAAVTIVMPMEPSDAWQLGSVICTYAQRQNATTDHGRLKCHFILPWAFSRLFLQRFVIPIMDDVGIISALSKRCLKSEWLEWLGKVTACRVLTCSITLPMKFELWDSSKK